MRFELMTKRITTSRSTRLNYCRMVVQLRFERRTFFLSGRLSNQLIYWTMKFLRGSESNASDNCL